MKSACSQHTHPHRLVQQPLVELTDRLRAGSRKVTGQREAILDVLRRHSSPLTNREIHDALGKTDCDLATIYRNMHTLQSMGLVKRCDFGDGAARFELISDEAHQHHHHLVCNQCSTIVEIEDCFPNEFEEDLAKRHGFSAVTHRLEFFGTCPRCQKLGTSVPRTASAPGSAEMPPPKSSGSGRRNSHPRTS